MLRDELAGPLQCVGGADGDGEFPALPLGDDRFELEADLADGFDARVEALVDGGAQEVLERFGGGNQMDSSKPRS